jgi:hypothetical protein
LFLYKSTERIIFEGANTMDFTFKSFSNASNFNNSKSETAGSLASDKQVETAGSLAWVSKSADFDTFNSSNPFVNGLGSMFGDGECSDMIAMTSEGGDFGGSYDFAGDFSSSTEGFSSGDASFTSSDCGGGDCGGGGGGDCGSFTSVG